MKKAALTIPEIMLIAGTRVMAGAGGALLLADKLRKGERKTLGWTLFLIGAISTIPLVLNVLNKRK